MIFALRHWREIALGLLVVALFAMWRSRERGLVERGKAIERARVADSALAALRPQLAKAETLLVRDTLRVRVAVERVRTVRDTVLQHLTDTVVVKAFIARTDTALAACSEMAIDCASYRKFAAATIAALEQKALSIPVARARSCTVPTIVGGILGAAATYAVVTRTRPR